MGDYPSLRTTEARTPLRRFRGILASITPEEREGDRGTYITEQFGFTDLEVIEVEEGSIYPFPIAVIPIPLSKSAGSAWGVFGKSALKLLGELDDVGSLIGHKQEWALLPVMLRRALVDEAGQPVIETTGRYAGKQAWGDVPVECWQVISIDGVSAPTDVTEDIVAMVDGKSDTEFHQAFQSSELARKNVALMTENVNRQLLPRLEKEGLIKRNAEGVWQRV